MQFEVGTINGSVNNRRKAAKSIPYTRLSCNVKPIATRLGNKISLKTDDGWESIFFTQVLSVQYPVIKFLQK